MKTATNATPTPRKDSADVIVERFHKLSIADLKPLARRLYHENSMLAEYVRGCLNEVAAERANPTKGSE